MRLRASGVLLSLALLSPACALGLAHPDRIGVGRLVDGTIIIEYRACTADTSISRVRLLDAHSTRGDSSDDVTLWEVSTRTPNRLRRFVVGGTPDGFSEVVALPGVPAQGLLRIDIESLKYPQGESFSFTLDELQTGQLRVGDGYQTEEQFRAGHACG